ncbi:hypothetical protein CP532_4106 [Ophiocordyceps camponoti-leonardi (nom. inval.)]|nr:hypothetical protein CP532_4106 [Ophiocordyceps camponoti-leonardi (nom. inval.)]
MRSFVVLTTAFLTASASIQVNHALKTLMAREVDSSCTGTKQQLVQEMMKDCFEMATKASAAAKQGNTEFLKKIFKTSPAAQVSANFDRIAQACANNSAIQIRCSPSQAECAAGLGGGNSLSQDSIAATAGPRMGVKLCPLTHDRTKVEKECGQNHGGGLLVHEVSHDILQTKDSSTGKYGYEVTLNETQPLNHADAYNFFAQAIGFNCSEKDLKKGGVVEGGGHIGRHESGQGPLRPEDVLPVSNATGSSSGPLDVAGERNSTAGTVPTTTSSSASSGPEQTGDPQLGGPGGSNLTEAGGERQTGTGEETGRSQLGGPGGSNLTDAGGQSQTGTGGETGRNGKDPLSQPEPLDGPGSNSLDDKDDVQRNGRPRPQQQGNNSAVKPDGRSSEEPPPSGPTTLPGNGGNQAEDNNSVNPLDPNQPGQTAPGSRTTTPAAAGSPDAEGSGKPGEAVSGSEAGLEPQVPGAGGRNQGNSIASPDPTNPRAGSKDRGSQTNSPSEQDNLIDSSGPLSSNAGPTNRGSQIKPGRPRQRNSITPLDPTASNARGQDGGSPPGFPGGRQGNLIGSVPPGNPASKEGGQDGGGVLDAGSRQRDNLIDSSPPNMPPNMPASNAAGPSRGGLVNAAGGQGGNLIDMAPPGMPASGGPVPNGGNPMGPAGPQPGNPMGSFNAVTPGTAGGQEADNNIPGKFQQPRDQSEASSSQSLPDMGGPSGSPATEQMVGGGGLSGGPM